MNRKYFSLDEDVDKYDADNDEDEDKDNEDVFISCGFFLAELIESVSELLEPRLSSRRFNKKILKKFIKNFFCMV
jgi:hypothetical protein